MRVRVYVEGGGDAASTKSSCREGFRTLFERITSGGDTPKVIASGGRQNAFEDFRDALRDHKEEVILLLVDSERPVNTGASNPWGHLRSNPDCWKKPPKATAKQAHLMVQSMEAWLLADKEALATYYGQRFLANALPRRPNVEDIPKSDLVPALECASRGTQKGKYHKTQHGFALLKLIDPARVGRASDHADRFFGVLKQEARRGENRLP